MKFVIAASRPNGPHPALPKAWFSQLIVPWHTWLHTLPTMRGHEARKIASSFTPMLCVWAEDLDGPSQAVLAGDDKFWP